MKKLFILFVLIFIAVSSSGIAFGAGSQGYVPLAPIPGLTGGTEIGTSATQSSPGLTAYLKQLYTWVVAAASGLAVVMIMWGGVEYMTSAGGGGVEEAKKRISAAILGLLLALGSYIILSTVNKDLLNLNFNLGSLSVEQGEFGVYNSNAVDKGPVSPQFSSSANPQTNDSLGGFGGAVNNKPTTPTKDQTDTSGSLGGSMDGIAPLGSQSSDLPLPSTQPTGDEPFTTLLPPLNPNN